MTELALPDDRLAWKDRDIVIEGRSWEAVNVKDTPTGRTIVRVHIGQNKWRTASCPKDGEWGWDHSR